MEARSQQFVIVDGLKMEEDKLFSLQNKIAEAYLAFQDAIKQVCDPLSDQDILELAREYRTDAKPNESHTFPMPIYDEIAGTLEAEVGIRYVFKQAEEYMQRTGEGFYCVACGGACSGHD